MMKAHSTVPRLSRTALIAPCGINCGVCLAFLRTSSRCPGCRVDDPRKPKTRTGCRIKTCAARRGPFCIGCADFPCQRLQHLDRRYRTKYGMSMIDNLRRIEAVGVRRFAEEERVRWTCGACGATICVHKPSCLICGQRRAAHQLIAVAAPGSLSRKKHRNQGPYGRPKKKECTK